MAHAASAGGCRRGSKHRADHAARSRLWTDVHPAACRHGASARAAHRRVRKFHERAIGRVAEGDLLAAGGRQALGDLEHPLRRHLALKGTAEAGRDHPLASDPGFAGGGDRFLEVGEGLGDRTVDVLSVVGLGGREEEVGLLEAIPLHLKASDQAGKQGQAIFDPAFELGAAGERA